MNPIEAICENYAALCQAEKWTLFLDPRIWLFLWEGLLITLRIALVATLFSLPVGTLLAIARLSDHRLIRLPATTLVEIIRALPVLFLIFFTFFAAARARLGLSPIDAATLALTIYTSAVNAEIIRSGIMAIDRGQREAASSLGLSEWQSLRFVILPQGLRRVVPPLASQIITLIKDTSLVAVLGVNELTARGQVIYNGSFNPLQTLLVVALIYFAVNYALSVATRRFERSRGWAGATARPAPPLAPVQARG